MLGMPEGLEVNGNVVERCPVSLVEVDTSRYPLTGFFATVTPEYVHPLDEVFKRELKDQDDIAAYRDPGSGRMVYPRWRHTVYDVMHEGDYVGGLMLRTYRTADIAIIGHMEIEEEHRGKRHGVATVVAAQLLLKNSRWYQDYELQSSAPRSASGEGVFRAMADLGLATREDTFDTAHTDASRAQTASWPHYTLRDLVPVA